MSKTRDHESYSFLKSALTPENPYLFYTQLKDKAL